MQSFSMEYCSYASFFQFYFFPFFFFFPPVLCCCCCCAVAVAGVAAGSTTGVSSASVIVISVFALLISLYSPAFFLLHRPRSLSLLPLSSLPRTYGSMNVIAYLALSPATQPSPVLDFPWQLPIFRPLQLYRFCILELCRRLGRRFLVLGRRLVAARVLILWGRRWWLWVWWRLKRRRGCGIWLLYGSV